MMIEDFHDIIVLAQIYMINRI